MAIVQFYLDDIKMGHQQQLCKILSNTTVVSCGPDKDYSHVSSVTLTLEIWQLEHLVKFMTHPWVMDSNVEILSKSNTIVVCYDPDKEYSCVQCDLDLCGMILITPYVKVTIHPNVMDNCMKYYPNST